MDLLVTAHSCLEVHPEKADSSDCEIGDLMALPYTMEPSAWAEAALPLQVKWAATGPNNAWSPLWPLIPHPVPSQVPLPWWGRGPDRSSTEREEGGGGRRRGTAWMEQGDGNIVVLSENQQDSVF